MSNLRSLGGLGFLLIIAMLATVLQTVVGAATKPIDTKTPRVIVPLYIYPVPGAWDPLYQAIRSNPKAAFLIIINPNSGPGNSAAPDSDYTSAIQQLRATASPNQTLELIGYVPTGYGQRSQDQVKSDITTYSKWPRSIRPDGIFFDETITTQNYLAKYRYYTEIVQRKSWGSSPTTKSSSNATYAQRTAITVLNPGTWPEYNGFWSIADEIVVYEDKLSNFDFGEYQKKSQSAKAAGKNLQRSYIFYNVDPGNVTTKDGKKFMGLDSLVNASIRTLGSRGGLFVTDLDIDKEDVYAKFSGIWGEFVKMVAAVS